MFKTDKTTETREAANYWPDRIEALAIEAEADALRDAPKYLTEYRAAHKADAATYKFDCRRHGDFLAVFIERGGKKEAVTLNLGRTLRFRLDAGHGPDNKGSLSYRYSLEPVGEREKGEAIYAGSGSDHYGRPTRPPEGMRYVVKPKYPSASGADRMVVADRVAPVGHSNMLMGGYYPEPAARHTTPNYPRPAADDRVILEGIGTTVFAPAGKGRLVLDRIHKEIAGQ